MWLFHLLLSNGGLCVWNMSTCGMFFKDSLEAQYHAVPWLSGQHQVMVILVPVSTPPCLYTWNSCSPQHGGKGDYVLMYPFYPQFEVHTYGCYGCFKITGQTEIKVKYNYLSVVTKTAGKMKDERQFICLHDSWNRKVSVLHNWLAALTKWLLGVHSLCILCASGHIN